MAVDRRSRARKTVTVGVVVFGILLGVDVLGTPLATVAIFHAESAATKAEHASATAEEFARALSAAVVRSRTEDCRNQEKLRNLGRRRLKQKEREAPADLRLLHIQYTPQIRALLRKGFAEERQLLAPVDCEAYGRKALP